MRALDLNPTRWFEKSRKPKSRGKAPAQAARQAAPLVRNPTWRETLGWVWRRNRRARQIGAGILALGLCAGGVVMFGPGLVQDISRVSTNGVEHASISAGFKLQSITVTGRDRTSRDQILAAVGIDRGGPILSIDPAVIRERLETLDWIDHAEVRRVLPDKLEISIHEAVPFAVWQQDGQFTLIDAKGRHITQNNVDAFAHLPLVVGAGAADKAAQIYAMLETEPTLKNRVQAAVRVGDRRWNIRFDNGVDLMLPEVGYAEAWHSFANIEAEHRLLARAISHVDMRLKDKLVVRLTDDGMKTMRVPGKST
jgi:cell division protein FtsQ